MGTVHRLARVRDQKPLPTLPEWAKEVLGELGIFNMGPVIGFELWGRKHPSVMMLDAHGCAVNASLSPSHPPEGFATRGAARAWALAFFAGLGRDVPEIRHPRRTPATTGPSDGALGRQGNPATDASSSPPDLTPLEGKL